MGLINYEVIKNIVTKNFKQAKDAIKLYKTETMQFAHAISDNIPNYEIEKIDFGAYIKDNFTVLFADMRNSTQRAITIGAEKTFLTMHAIIPAFIYIIEKYQGSIIDIPGDGIIALYKENKSGIRSNGFIYNSETLATRSAEVLIYVLKNIINPLLIQQNIDPVEFGIGIDSGDVIVTKIGTNKTFDSKAIGDCINNASKLSSMETKILISNNVYTNLYSKFQEHFDSYTPYDLIYKEILLKYNL